MNDHDDIRKLLSAYSSGELEPVMTARVEQHLTSCTTCRVELAELSTTLRLIRSTPEVEPPPWLTARTMARVRALQTEKRSWLQRIFFPLRIKLPLEALALLMVCVTGWYISRTVETELTKPAPQELRHIPAAPAPSAEQGLPEKRDAAPRPLQQIAPPPTTPPTAPKMAEQPSPAPYQAVPPAAPASILPSPALKTESGAPAGAGRSETLKAAPAAESFNRAREAVPEKKSKDSGSLERAYDTAAPAPAGRSAAKQSLPSLLQIGVRLQPADQSAAPDEVREALIRSGGSNIDESGMQRQRLKARILPARFDELLQRLERIGRLAEHPAPPAGTREIEVTVQW